MELRRNYRTYFHISLLFIFSFLESHVCWKEKARGIQSSNVHHQHKETTTTNQDADASARISKQLLFPVFAWPYSLGSQHNRDSSSSFPSFLHVVQYHPNFFAVIPSSTKDVKFSQEKVEHLSSHAYDSSATIAVEDSTQGIPCSIRDNEVGTCKSFTECFPMMEVQYGSANYIDFMDVPLAEQLILNTNHSLCSQSDHLAADLNVCCPSPTFKNSHSLLQIRRDDNNEIKSYVPDENLTGPVITQRPPLRNVLSRRLKNEQKCGNSRLLQGSGFANRHHGKVTGGHEAKGPQEFPWMVAVFGKNNKIFCGASLISDQFLLTAAHCFSTFKPTDIPHLYVHLGDFNIKTTADGPHEVRKIEKVILHKGFNINNYHNDIALLKLDRPVSFTDRISPICLPEATMDSLEQRQIIVTGWGRKYRYGTTVDILRKVAMPVWSLQECKNIYSRFAPGRVLDSNLCAGDGRRDKDACLGDSGGPAIMFDGMKYVLIGITSWGKGCGSFPGVYTKTSKYLMWVTKNLHQFG